MVRRWTVWPLTALAALALSVGVVLPETDHSGTTRHFYVELYRYPQGGFPVSGTLDLTYHERGVLTGYYRPTDGGVRPVTGQLFGEDKIQLDFGGPEALHVIGRLSGGTIEGRGYRAFARQLYDFRGLPIPDDQALPHVTPRPWPSALI